MFRDQVKFFKTLLVLDKQIDTFATNDLHILYNLLIKLIKKFDKFTAKTETLVKIIDSLSTLKIKVDEKYNEESKRGTQRQLKGHGFRPDRNQKRKARFS